jgi:hypothetical protein
MKSQKDEDEVWRRMWDTALGGASTMAASPGGSRQ